MIISFAIFSHAYSNYSYPSPDDGRCGEWPERVSDGEPKREWTEEPWEFLVLVGSEHGTLSKRWSWMVSVQMWVVGVVTVGYWWLPWGAVSFGYDTALELLASLLAVGRAGASAGECLNRA